MDSIVLELQRDCLDRNVSVSELLRKAFFVAQKLGVENMSEWLSHETHGYEGVKEVPPYRIISGQLKAFNPYRGWQEVIFQTPEDAKVFSKRSCGQSVAELEEILRDKADKSPLMMPYPPDVEAKLRDAIEFDTGIALHVQRTALVRILEAVRTTILNWALQLEKDGILGEGLRFTKQEHDKANRGGYSVVNFYAPLSGSQVQIGTSASSQTMAVESAEFKAIAAFLSSLTEKKHLIALSEEPEAELGAEMATIRSQLESPRPKKGILRESLGSVKRILEAAGGNVAGQLIVEVGKAMLSS